MTPNDLVDENDNDTEQIVEQGHWLNFHELTAYDVNEFILSHDQPLGVEELYAIEDFPIDEPIDAVTEPPKTTEMSKADVDTILYQIKFLSELIDDKDCDEERKASFKNSLQQFSKIYSELKPKKKQSTISNFFAPKK